MIGQADIDKHISKRWHPDWYAKQKPGRKQEPRGANATAHAKAVFFDIVKRDKPESILDVGCGSGSDCPVIEGMGIRYVGVEPVQFKYEQACRRHGASHFRVALAHNLPCADETFDWVWLSGVWEVIPEEHMGAVIIECMRVAKSRVYARDTLRKPVAMAERYISVPQAYGLSFRRIWYDRDLDKAHYLWEIRKPARPCQ